MVYPASGTGAWEAALVNTLSPGDAVLMVETGWFASLWAEDGAAASASPSTMHSGRLALPDRCSPPSRSHAGGGQGASHQGRGGGP